MHFAKLPFEPEWYRQHGCEATYVGHPYFDDFLNRKLDESFIRDLGDEPLLAVLPGSRKHEVENNLPAFLKTIDFVQQSLPNVKFAVGSYNHHQANVARKLIETHQGSAKPEVYIDRTRELIHKADCCLACSGSVSLELLHESTPTVIHYKIDKFIDFMQRRMKQCKFITLVNLLTSEHRFDAKHPYNPDDIGNLAEAPFPEYMTAEDRSAEMAIHLIRWMSNEDARKQVVERLAPLRESFVKPGASKRAADFILEKLSKSRLPKQYLPSGTKVA